MIEAVVMVCLLATLAAVVLPRLDHLQRDARVGRLKGIRGAFITGATLVNAHMLRRQGAADPAPCAGSDGVIADNQLTGAGTACVDGRLVRTMNGYPAAQEQGALAAAAIGGHPRGTPAQLAEDGFAVTHFSGSTTAARVDAASPAHCSFTYTEPAMSYTAPSFAPLVTSGC